LKDDTQLFKEFSDNESFRRWLTDTVFALTYEAQKGSGDASAHSSGV
jgi:type I restriction enzyme, R subunit